MGKFTEIFSFKWKTITIIMENHVVRNKGVLTRLDKKKK